MMRYFRIFLAFSFVYAIKPPFMRRQEHLIVSIAVNRIANCACARVHTSKEMKNVKQKRSVISRN